MEENTPTKPPRGVKQTKETSRLLMSVIHSLSASTSDEQREKEKQKLERDYEKSNKKLDELVSKHYDQLTRVIQAFGKVSTQITTSRERMTLVRQNLEECKVLLRCKREELRKLWLEGVEHKHTLQLLQDISQLSEIPVKIGQNLARKQYTAATESLISALTLSEGQLAGVEALRDVRTELMSKKQLLYSKLMEELRHHIYEVPTTDALHFRRQGSGKEAALSPFQRGHIYLRGSKGTRAKRKLLDVPFRGAGDMADVEYGDDETDGLDAQERAQIWFTTVGECLCLLKKMPESIESIKSEMQSELQSVIPRATREVLDNSQTVPGQKSTDAEGGQLLLELLEIVLDQMKKIASAHSLLLRCFSKICSKHNVAIRLYDMMDVWGKIQAVLQLWLSEYLDSGVNSIDSHDAPTFNQPALDISSYFARRKQPRQKKVRMFRFSHSTSSFSFAKEQKDNAKISQTLVCPTDINNITLVYAPLSRLVEELEQNGPSPCPLHVYLQNYVRDVFMKTHHAKLSTRITNAIKEKDAWRAVTDSEVTKKMGLSKPLLQSTITVERIIVELRNLMGLLPEFTDKLLVMLTHLLSNYREVCQAAYRGIVQPDSEDKRIFSSTWLKDEDINRFLKSLPNWVELQAHKPTHRNRRLRREETAEEESPEDVRQRNVKEAEILASNINEGGIQRSELISDVGQLKKIAQLHESMEWLAAQALLVASDLKVLRESEKPKCKVPEEIEQKLFQLVHEFTELADICLLVLHLEVRVQCFHYLPSKVKATQKHIHLEPDRHVTDLAKVLTSIHEVMVASLQPRKTKYIFEGLGHLIAKILISSAQYFDRIDEVIVDRMSRNILALQQTLSKMTATRDLALDHAKSYFQLFHHSPDELLAVLLERGPSFSDMEYFNAIQLLDRSHPNRFGPVQRNLQRLSDILGETGVTV